MKTSEFKKKVEELGYECTRQAVRKDGYICATFNKSRMYAIDTVFNGFIRLDESEKELLFSLLIEYASTPIEEREDEKRYRLRLTNKTATVGDIYLNKGFGEFVLDTGSNSQSYQTIFTESELKDIDETEFIREEVK